MNKSIKTLLLTTALTLSVSIPVSAATFSEYWHQNESGNWYVQDLNGNIIKNAWLCDDAIEANGKDIWYLLDANGNMISSGLVQDQTGNYYSLETNHNGYFGMLRYVSGNYDGITLDLESSHNGSFAEIKNDDAIIALQNKYGLQIININNDNCIYTSTFRSTNNVSDGKVTHEATTNTQQNTQQSVKPQQDSNGVAYGTIQNGNIYTPDRGWISLYDYYNMGSNKSQDKNAPKNGDISGNKIYIDGRGWVDMSEFDSGIRPGNNGGIKIY